MNISDQTINLILNYLQKQEPVIVLNQLYNDIEKNKQQPAEPAKEPIKKND